MKIAIVGGGAVGLSSALWLASYGHAVEVYEQGVLGGGAMGAAAGILGAQSESDTPHKGFEAYLRARALWAVMAEVVSGGAPALGYRCNGLLKLSHAERGADLQETARWQTERGARAQVLSSDALRERFPHVGNALKHGLWFADEAHVDPRLAAQTIGDLLGKMACVLHEHTPAPAVAELLQSYDRVLVAAGASSTLVLPQLVVHPVRGQLLEKLLVHAAPMPVLMHRHTYAVPRGDGRIVVGATVELGRDDVQVDASCTESLEAAALALWPALAQATTQRQWAGVRPYVAEGPILREVAARLWVSVGHYRNGILLALDAGERVAEQMLSQRQEPVEARRAIDALYTRIQTLSRG